MSIPDDKTLTKELDSAEICSAEEEFMHFWLQTFASTLALLPEAKKRAAIRSINSISNHLLRGSHPPEFIEGWMEAARESEIKIVINAGTTQ